MRKECLGTATTTVMVRNETTSTIINATITKNPKNLDIGSLISTVGHLFADIRFIAKLKHEFIMQEIGKKLQEELNEINDMYGMMQA